MTDAQTPKPASANSQAPATSNTPAPAAEEIPQVEDTSNVVYSVNGRGLVWNYHAIEQKKGPNAGTEHLYVTPGEVPFSTFLTNLAKAIGEDVFQKAIMNEVIRPACKDAERALSTKLKEDQEATPEQFIEEFFQALVPGSRTGVDGIKALKDKLVAMTAELQPLMDAYMKLKDKMPPEDLNRLIVIQGQFGELVEKVEDKGRSGKKATKGKNKAAKGNGAANAPAPTTQYPVPYNQ